MYEAAVIGTVLLVVVAGGFYIRQMWRREIDPVLATWVLLMVMISLSFWMYWESPNKSLTRNIALTANVINIAIILAGVVATHLHYGTLRVAFNRVQRWCLLGGAVIVGIWFVTRDPLLSYVLLQIIAVFAYLATVIKLWKAEVTSEPYYFWFASLFSNLCALYPAWLYNDIFSWIFLGRAIPSNVILIYLIWRIKRRG